MDNLLNRKHVSGFFQFLCDCFICIIGLESCKFAGFLGQATFVVNRNDDGNFRIMVNADFKVLYTVSRSGMNTSCTGIQCNMVTDNNQRITVKEWMLANNVLQIFTSYRTDQFIITDGCSFHCSRSKLFCHDVVFAVCFYCAVFIVRTKADCHVTRQSPGGCGPDYKEGLCRINAQSRQFTFVIFYCKFYIDGEARIFFVLNFSFCQCSVTVRAPVNWFEALVNIAFLSHVSEDFDLFCLKFWFEGHIWVVPFTQNTQTFKLCSLSIQIV